MEIEEGSFYAPLSAVASNSVNLDFVSSSGSMGCYLYLQEIEVVWRRRFDPSFVAGDHYLILSHHLSQKLPILAKVVVPAEVQQSQLVILAARRFASSRTPFQRRFASREG